MSHAQQLEKHAAGSVEYFDQMLELIPASYYFAMKGRIANQKYWLNLRELAPKLALKQKTKKAQKSALVAGDLSAKSIPELISAGFEQESSSDDSDSTDVEDDDMEVDSAESEDVEGAESDGGSESGSEKENGARPDEDGDSDSDDSGIAFVPKGTIKGVNMNEQRELLRQKLMERINSSRRQRKAAPLGPDGRVLVDEAPYSKRRASMEKKKAESDEQELSRRQLKNQKKRDRKEQALKSLSKSMPASSSAYMPTEDSDEDMAPAKKKKKEVEEDLDFGKVQFEDGHAKSHHEKRQDKRLTKQQLLDKLQREKAYEQRMQGTEEGERIKEDKAWSKTFKRLEGEKVKDRADLLKKSLKREEASKRKSHKEWEERKSSVKASMDERYKKRNANIKERVDSMKLKRMGKKAKPSKSKSK